MLIKNPVNLIIINQNNEILLAKRILSDKEGGKWSIPGGNSELDETFEQSLNREIKEELSCEIKNFKYFKSYTTKENNNNDIIIIRSIYFYGEISGEIVLNNELSEYQWFNIDNLKIKEMDLAFNQNKVFEEFINFWSNKLE
jgi:8-oxo-dGTP diphosphatase